jgi:pimeloyl-ACP methyl ester carboxylesterase
MLRWLFKIVVGVVAVIAVAVSVAAVMFLEFGERPASSLRPMAGAADVKFVEANGVRFAYLEEGQGPLVLLFHGFPETARSWRVVQQRLAAAGYRVVAPFMRGYPPTAFAADGDYSSGALGKDVVALIDAFGSGPAIIVGHDWGASAVYAAATSNPEKVSKLVALAVPHARAFAGDSSSFIFEAPHFLIYQLPTTERLLWSYDFAHIDLIYRRCAPGYVAPAEVMDDIKSTLRVPGATAGVLGYYWNIFKRDPAEAAAAAAKPISVPTLVIGGAADCVIRPSRFAKARATFTGDYRYVEFATVGHFPQLEAPEETAAAILDFIGPSAPKP